MRDTLEEVSAECKINHLDANKQALHKQAFLFICLDKMFCSERLKKTHHTRNMCRSVEGHLTKRVSGHAQEIFEAVLIGKKNGFSTQLQPKMETNRS